MKMTKYPRRYCKRQLQALLRRLRRMIHRFVDLPYDSFASDVNLGASHIYAVMGGMVLNCAPDLSGNDVSRPLLLLTGVNKSDQYREAMSNAMRVAVFSLQVGRQTTTIVLTNPTHTARRIVGTRAGATMYQVE